MQIKISHSTTYDYDAPVTYALQRTRLTPVSSPLQTVHSWDMQLSGAAVQAGYKDHHGNQTHLLSADDNTQSLTITVTGEVETHDKAGVLGKIYGRAPLWYFKQATDTTAPGPLITKLAGDVSEDGSGVERLHGLSRAILEKVPYELNETHAATLAEEAMALGHGVCQDHANIFVSAARLLGLPARYVSGYLFMEDRVDQDASHAWAEVHIDGLGWVGFDVSNGISPDERYVRLATGRDAQDAAPVSGLRVGAGDESLIVSLQVQQ